MRVIINADDFGLHESCSLAIAEAFRQGMVSNTTACANGDYIEEAIQLARERGFIENVGIHFNITTGYPITEKIRSCRRFCSADGSFHQPNSRVFPLCREEVNALSEELRAQLNRLKMLGLTVHHADSHHHVHTAPAFVRVFRKILIENEIKTVRIIKNTAVSKKKNLIIKCLNFCFYRRHFITTDYFSDLSEIIEEPLEFDGFIEIMLHPDFAQDGKTLINRIRYREKIPEGKQMEDFSKFYNSFRGTFLSYKEYYNIYKELKQR